MTATVTDSSDRIVAADGVCAPQHDSWLLIEAVTKAAVSAGQHVLDAREPSSEPAARLTPSVHQAMVAGLLPQLANIFRRSSLTDPGGAE
jgi:hypothetical protein